MDIFTFTYRHSSPLCRIPFAHPNQFCSSERNGGEAEAGTGIKSLSNRTHADFIYLSG